ncbi:MAG TPA: energy-coupling factor transporter transmembrane component T [Actinomycetes bacterium]|nr:energy-coupling factor transporter transmembrane component T [Actinomycetes bacterium]
MSLLGLHGARPRQLHPVAWWLWALGLAATATRTTNPVLLLSIVAVAALVVSARRGDGPWGQSFRSFLLLGVVVLAVRVLFEVLFGAPLPGTVILTLPDITLPEWTAGVRIGGSVTAEAVLAAIYAGLQLVAILACVGAANALVEPSRLLKVVPGALYEVAVAVVVALSVAPQAVVHTRRIREARHLRGRPPTGLRALAGIALPVLEGALERSLALAAAMDSRGFGRSRHVAPTERRVTAALVLLGLAAACVGGYALLDAGTPGWQGLAALVSGTVVAVGGLVRAGRRSVRTVYRPDPWRSPEWVTTLVGLATAAVTVGVALALGPEASGLTPPLSPLAWPELPVLPFLAVLLAAAPAVLTPAPQAAEVQPATGQRRPASPLARPRQQPDEVTA